MPAIARLLVRHKRFTILYRSCFDQLGAVSILESQIEDMQRQLASMKESGHIPVKKAKKEKKHKAEKIQPVASSSKSAPKTNGSAKLQPSNRKKMSKKPVTDDDVLSFEQKKELSDSIAQLDGTKLERVIQIIHEGVPEIRDVRSNKVFSKEFILICVTPAEY